MSEKFPIYCKVSELQLGDVVEWFEGAFGTAIVKQIEDGVVTLFRPYGATADFSTSGGVICYTGIEQGTYATDSKETFKVYSRKKLT